MQQQQAKINWVGYQCLIAAFFLLRACSVVWAQDITAFLPEVDSYFRLTSNVRFAFDAKGYMEDGDLNHAQLGPGLQLNFRPFESLKEITVFDLDDIKCVPVVFTIGYRYLPSTTQPIINRMQPIVMFHIPFPARILITDRNRADLDWSNGSFDWTYRNRVTAERRVAIRSYHPGPYAAAEFAYQSQYAKWTTTRLFGGLLLPLSKQLQLDSYFEHLNNTGPHPSRQVNAGGLILNVYLSRNKS